MTSTPTSGYNQFTIMLSLLMAFVLIGLMVYMGRNSTPYSMSVSSFQPNEDIFYRLDGTITPKDGYFALCESEKCIRLEVPKGMLVEPGKRVMVEGRYRGGIFEASNILMRCDHTHGRNE